MFKINSVSSIEYYIENADDAEPAINRDRMAYYTDTVAGEPPGVIWCPRLPADSPVKFRFAQSGTVADSRSVRAWAKGNDPATGRPLVKKRPGTTTKVGYDLTFSSPKTVSALWVCDPSKRLLIEQAQTNAVERALQFAFDMGLIVTRRGARSSIKEPALDIVSARYRHHTTRAGDPEIHDHVILMSVAQCADGKVRTLDSVDLKKWQKALTNVYRAELAAEMRTRVGVAVIPDVQTDHGFHVAGIPDQFGATGIWSSRRKAIKDWMRAHTGSSGTAGSGAMAQAAALATRNKKVAVPKVADLDNIGGRWDLDLEKAGWSRDGVAESVRQATYLAELNEMRLADSGGITVAELNAMDRRNAALTAISKLEETESVLEERSIYKVVFEACQHIGNIDEIQCEIRSILNSNRLKEIGRLPDGERVFCSPALESIEREMLLECQRRRDERQWATPEAIESSICSAKVPLSDEQADAVRWAMNSDGISIVEGGPGTGKSTSLSAVADCSRALGYHVWAIAPSHKAKDVVSADTCTEETSSKALTGFLNRLNNPGKNGITLSKADVVILDEAMMCGLTDVAKLIKNLNGAKLICSGDTRQLQPVSGGAPVAAIMRLNSSSRISEIRRQSVEWQRAASMAMSAGNISDGLDAYDLRGHVTWGSTREETINALVADVRSDLLGSAGNTPENLQHLPPRIVIATRNTDIRDLNSALRPVYRECGLITGPDFVVNAIGRGSHQFEAPLHIAVGDRLVFGETIKLSEDMIASQHSGGSPQAQISNSDFGTILSITSSDDPTNPIVQIKMDKGVIIESKWNNLSTKSDQQTRIIHAPKIQHAFSCTAHASQGSTVSRAYIFDGHGGMTSEAALVSLTRHRVDARIYIDTSPVREALESRSPDMAIKISQKGTLDAPDQGDSLSGDQISILLADIKKSIRAIYNRSSMKTNISAFANDINDWLACEESLGSTNVLSSGDPNITPWFYQKDGFESFSAAMMAEAELAHKKWQASNPDLHTLDIIEYVRSVQRRHTDNIQESEPPERTRDAWHPHSRLPPTSPMTSERLEKSMRKRMNSTVAFPVPDLQNTPLPKAIEELVAAHQVRDREKITTKMATDNYHKQVESSAQVIKKANNILRHNTNISTSLKM